MSPFKRPEPHEVTLTAVSVTGTWAHFVTVSAHRGVAGTRAF
jgi:hypothetical protein